MCWWWTKRGVEGHGDDDDGEREKGERGTGLMTGSRFHFLFALTVNCFILFLLFFFLFSLTKKCRQIIIISSPLSWQDDSITPIPVIWLQDPVHDMDYSIGGRNVRSVQWANVCFNKSTCRVHDTSRNKWKTTISPKVGLVKQQSTYVSIHRHELRLEFLDQVQVTAQIVHLSNLSCSNCHQQRDTSGILY